MYHQQRSHQILKIVSILVITSTICNISFSNSFTSSSASKAFRQRTTFDERRRPRLFWIANKYFQLEELEDADRCTTEIHLENNSNVYVYETDGPRFLQASGNWELSNSGEFTMTLNRRYLAGRQQRDPTDMGEFYYNTVRKFIGDIGKVGAQASVQGKIFDIDDTFGNREVGFFEMIDTTDIRNEVINNSQNAARY